MNDQQTKRKPSSSANLQEKYKKPDLSTLVYGKLPPQACDIEEAVLGAIMLEKEKQDEVFDIITDKEVFYRDEHQRIFEAINTMYQRGQTIDLLTVTEELRKKGDLEIVGGAYNLTMLTMSVLSSAHVESHAKILLEKYMSREMIRIGGALVKEAYEDSSDVFDTMDFAENSLDKIKNKIITKPYRKVVQGVIDATKRIEELKANKKEITGVTTGFRSLNILTSGLQNSNLIIIAARPSVGKTSFSLNLAINCASDKVYGGPVGVFNLEMSENEIINREVSSISKVKMDNINNPIRLTPDDDTRLGFGYKQLSELPILHDDTAGLSINELRAKARKMKKREGIKLLIIDYLQLMTTGTNGGNREQEIAKISRELKKLAKELNIPIIALSQMNRDVDKDDRSPELSDLRESGAIEQDADIVMFLWRPSPKKIKLKPELAGKILCMVKKHRNGQCDDIALEFNNDIQYWRENEPQFQSLSFSAPIKNDNQKDDLPF